MISNVELFKECLDHKVSYIDPIFRNINNKNYLDASEESVAKVLDANARLIENLTEYNNLKKDASEDEREKLVYEIKNCLKVPGMNKSPFSQYLMVHNLSYDIYISDLNYFEQKEIITAFLEDRHELYLQNNYSDIIFQVLNDSYSHKRKGAVGLKKLEKIFRNHNFKHYNESEGTDRYFIFPDSKDKKLFCNILAEEDIVFIFSQKKQTKMPDAMVRNGNDFYIIEHKNLKGSGGGQDKQMVEVIDFIGNKERFISYISYLDGPYFNLLKNPSSKNKLYRQKQAILKNLEENKNNYFVNSFGFEKIIKEKIQ